VHGGLKHALLLLFAAGIPIVFDFHHWKFCTGELSLILGSGVSAAHCSLAECALLLLLLLLCWTRQRWWLAWFCDSLCAVHVFVR
jgi:hypothetical protein